MRPAKKEIIEIDVEPDLVGHQMRRGLKRIRMTHDHVLPAKRKDSAVEKFRQTCRGANPTSGQIIDCDDDDDDHNPYGVPKGRSTEGSWSSETVPVVRTTDTQQRKGDCVRRKQKASLVKKNVELKPKCDVPLQRKSRLDRVQSTEVPKSEARKKRSEKNKVISDDEFYKLYLNSLDAEKSSRISPERSSQVKRGRSNEFLPDSDITAVSDYPFSDEDDTPFVAARNRNVVDVDEKSGEPGNACNSWFKKELRAILRQPYDEMEFVRLSFDVSNKKPIIRQRELRCGRAIDYETDIPGDSYLEKFPDFERRLHSCRKDRRRALNLLRGFFFYLKNVVHDCAFKPWQDEECLRTSCPSENLHRCID